MKKVISFIVILIAYSILGVALVLGTSNFGLGYGKDDAGARIDYSYALDRAGNIYYVSDNGGKKSLMSLDSSGKRLFETKLDAAVFGDHFYVGGIYIEHDMGIYVTTYSYDEKTHFINEAAVHLFYDDGTYVDEIFRDTMWFYPEGGLAPISAFSEDDVYVYFSLLKNGSAELFRARKDNAEPVAKVGDYDVVEEQIYGWITLPSGDLLMGTERGIRVYTKHFNYLVEGTENSIYDGFYTGIGLYYAMDSAGGDLHVISEDYRVSSVVSGDRIINANDELSLNDMSEVAVGITGNILGVKRDTVDAVYVGSFSLMSEIYMDSADRAQIINAFLVLGAVAAGVILLSILTWDFYCSILKMRLSILLRQSLLIALLMFVGLYALSYLVIIPQVEDIVISDYSHEAQMLANSFEHAMNGMLVDSNQTSRTAYAAFLQNYSKSVGGASAEDTFEGDDETPRVNLIENAPEGVRLLASSEHYATGYPANRLLFGHDINAVMTRADEEEVFITSNDLDGEKLYLCRRIELADVGNPVYMLVETRVDALSSAVDHISEMVTTFLVIGGAVIVLLFMIIENITASAVRKLKRSVNKIAGGNYGAVVDINTGDEVEELSLAVKALSTHIVDKTTSLEALNQSYYRFVPLEFLKNLGETKFEKVTKSLHTKREMTTLYLRFSFSRNLSNAAPQEIFNSINAVFEEITPIISDNGGTAYNFLSDGFNAIFPDSTEKALLAAIQCREVLASYNEVRRLKGERTVEARMIIGKAQVLLGFIGDDRRMAPTAVSTAINESEEIAKIAEGSGLYIVATESAFNSLPKGKYRNRCIGHFATATSGVQKLYDMFDSDPYALVKLKEQFMTRFELGVRLFDKGDYANARAMFMDIVKYASEDGVSRNYMYLAEHNLNSDSKHTTYTVYTL